MTRFTPAEIETWTGWHPQGLRDLRSKGYLDSYGEVGGNARWTYAATDLAAFWIASALHEQERGSDLPQIFARAHHAARLMMPRLKGGRTPRYLATIFRSAIEGGTGGSSSHQADDLGYETGGANYEVRALDLHALADMMPADLRAAIREAGD